MPDVPVHRRDKVLEYLMTSQQLRVADRQPGNPERLD